MKWFESKHIDLSDDQLIQKIKDESSSLSSSDWTAALFSRYIELIYGVSLKYFKNEEDSKDACMDIFEGIEKKIKKHNIQNFKSWLYTVVKNHCLEKLRKTKRENEKIKQVPIMHSEEVFHPFSEDLKEQTLQKLEICIEKLKTEQKQCIDMFYLKKLSYEQIANNLKLDWSKVRSLIQNGRRNLKICLDSK